MPDAPEQDLLAPGFGVELPAGLAVDQRHRERVVLRSKHQDRLLLAFHADRVPGLIGGGELLPIAGIGDLIAGGYDVLTVRSEHLQHLLLDPGLDGGRKRCRRLVR